MKQTGRVRIIKINLLYGCREWSLQVDCEVCRWHLLLEEAGNGADVPF